MRCDIAVKIWKYSKFWTAKKKPLTVAIVAALLNDNHVTVKRLYSEKAGKKYDTMVVLVDADNGFSDIEFLSVGNLAFSSASRH